MIPEKILIIGRERTQLFSNGNPNSLSNPRNIETVDQLESEKAVGTLAVLVGGRDYRGSRARSLNRARSTAQREYYREKRSDRGTIGLHLIPWEIAARTPRPDRVAAKFHPPLIALKT